VRRGAVLAAQVLVALLSAAPVHALETRSFGLEPGEGADTEEGTERLVVRPDRGGTARTTVRVWNRTGETMTLQLTAEAVEVGDDGSARLGGDGRAAGWISFSERSVRLAPRGDTTVEVRVHAPRRAGSAERTAAVVAQPVAAAGTTPAVVERLALVVYVRPGDDGGFGRWVAVAALAIVVVATAAAVSATRRWRRRGTPISR
jgi:hypothetical protein